MAQKLSQPDMHPAGALGITTRFQELSPTIRQVSHALLTRSPLSPPNKSPVDPVRLACVKHAASVRPEPGSNSPNKNKNVKAQKNQPNKTAWPAIPTKNHTPPHKQSAAFNQTTTYKTYKHKSSTKHALEFSNHHHTPRTHPHTGSTPQQAATKNNTPPTPPHTTPACRTPHHTTHVSDIHLPIATPGKPAIGKTSRGNQ